MKTDWLTACVGTLIGCAASFAPAAMAEVVLYGRLNLDVEMVSGAIESGANPHVFRVNSNSSNFGVRGTEPLTSDWSTVFQLECSVGADGTGDSALAGRDTYVGLAGPIGVFRVGFFLPPYDDIHIIFGNAPTLTTSILSTSALWAQGGAPTLFGGFDNRLPNSVRWDSPRVSGFAASAQYSTMETSPHANIAALGASFVNSGIQTGIAYTHNHSVRAPDLNDDAISAAALYSIGPVDIGGVYEHLRYGMSNGELKRDLWGASVTVSQGAGVFYGFFGRAGKGKGSVPDGTRLAGLAKGPDTGADQWELSYSYFLSQRTVVYVGYTRIANDANASYTFSINRYPLPIGSKPQGLILGLSHFF